MLLALFNVHSYAIRGFHALLSERGYQVESTYFKSSTYTDTVSMGQIGLLVEHLAKRRPDVVAVSVHSPVFSIFKALSALIRQRMPGCKIAVGGEHATACPQDCLPYADYVIPGEGDTAILELADGNMKQGINGPYKPLEDLDVLPIGHYGPGTWLIDAAPEPFHSYLAGRGCPFSCSYCHESVRRAIHGKGYRARRKSADKVVADIAQLKQEFGLKHVVFSDSIFTSDKTSWLESFCEKFARLKMSFVCYGHAANLTQDTIVMLKQAGMNYFRTGVQSGSQYIRSAIFNRKDSLDQILSVFEILKSHGLNVSFDFISGNPYDTWETQKETRSFISKLAGAGISIFELRWFPGTPLTQRALVDGYIGPQDVEGQFLRLGSWNYNYVKA